MRFVTIAAKNLARRPARSLLTVFGLAIAIAAIVSLLGASDSLQNSLRTLYRTRGADLIVQRRGGMVQISKGIAESFGDRIRALPQTGAVVSGLLDLISFEDRGLYMVIIEGIEAKSLVLDRVKLVAGRRLQAGDGRCAMLGRVLAENLKKRPGDTIKLYEHPFQVVGIFDALSVYESGAAFVLLSELQREMDRPGQVTGFLVQARPPGDAAAMAALKTQIEALDPDIAAIPADEFVHTVSQMRITRTMSWIIAGIAGILGSLSVLNTMAMSVFERRAEIGALRAIGWRKSRIVRLICGESLLLAAGGVALGIPAGEAALSLLAHWHVTSNIVQDNVSLRTIGQAVLLAAAMAAIGALYPALRIARVPPVESLRGT